MKLQIISVGSKMPSWVEMAFLEYKKRFPREFTLSLKEIPLKKRTSNRHQDILRIIEEEGEKIIAAIPEKSFTIALDERGKSFTTLQLSQKLSDLQSETPMINFLIGGPDGLAKKCIEQADLQWSLSNLTLPHPLVRVILIEQLYRAISILNHHPYHRE